MVEIEANEFGVLRAIASGSFGLHFNLTQTCPLAGLLCETNTMGRWTQYDEDDYRLPEGMKRIGYDADSGRYYFRDREGLLYNGPEGSKFGVLTLASDIPTSIPKEVDGGSDLEVMLAVDKNHIKRKLKRWTQMIERGTARRSRNIMNGVKRWCRLCTPRRG